MKALIFEEALSVAEVGTTIDISDFDRVEFCFHGTYNITGGGSYNIQVALDRAKSVWCNLHSVPGTEVEISVNGTYTRYFRAKGFGLRLAPVGTVVSATYSIFH